MNCLMHIISHGLSKLKYSPGDNIYRNFEEATVAKIYQNMSSLALTFKFFILFLCILQNILNVCQLNLSVLTNTVCRMIGTVMVMMTVEMGVMRQAAM